MSVTIKSILTFLAVLLLAVNANALDLQEAKQQGLLGERFTGYIGVVTEDSAAKAIAGSVNAKRKAHYQSIAKRNGTSLSSVERLAGGKTIKRTLPEQYIDRGNGWERK